MTDLLKAFDNMVLKAFRDTDDVESMLKSDAFWKEVDETEAKLAEDEDLARLEVKLQIEIEQLEKEMALEVVHIEQIIRGAEEMSEEEALALAAEEKAVENELYKGVPALRHSILMKRYAKYRVYSQGIAEMQHERDLDPGKSLVFREEGEDGKSGFATGMRALWMRKMNVGHVKLQRAAEKDGAFVPPGSRPVGALNAQKLQFVGPVFGSKRPPSVVDESNDTNGHDSTVQEEEFVPGTRWKPPPMPELRPPAPKIPTRRDLIYASWSRPGQTGKDTTDRAKANFFDMHIPKAREGVPKPPSLPGAMRAPPQKGEEIPSHKLRMEGLPRNCTEDMVLEWMGADADNVNQNYNNAKESYKKGIAIYKGADGWLTGKGAIKFLSKPACLRAIASLHRRCMGTRVIYLDYVIEKVLPPRGRLKLVNLHRKTTSKDLEKFFRGWHLGTAEDNQEPELIQDEEGFNTGEAILTFEDVESSDNCLVKFVWGQLLHGMTLRVFPTPPLRYDDINEKWFEAHELGNSTEKLLSDNPSLKFVNRPETPVETKRNAKASSFTRRT